MIKCGKRTHYSYWGEFPKPLAGISMNWCYFAATFCTCLKTSGIKACLNMAPYNITRQPVGQRDQRHFLGSRDWCSRSFTLGGGGGGGTGPETKKNVTHI